MLKRLEILNGEMSLKFDYLNTVYTIKMTSYDQELKINYEIDETDKISIFNNHLTNNKTEVVITVYNEEETTSYYLEVYPKKENTATNTIDYFESLEVQANTYTPQYIAPLIASICFIVILFFFAILFKNKKKNK